MRKRNRIFNRRAVVYLIVVCFGILLYFALNNYAALKAGAARLISIFSPFINGAVIAFLLNIPMAYIERKCFSRFRRARLFALLSTYLLALMFIMLLLRLVVPQIIESISTLVGNTNQYLGNLNELMDWVGRQFDLEPESVDQFRVSYKDIFDHLLEMAQGILPDVVNISMRVGSGLVGILTSTIASIYMLASKDTLFRQCRRVLYAFVPKRGADSAVRVTKLSIEVFTGFVSGKIIDSAIIGVICFAGLYIIDLTAVDIPFYPLISVIVAVTNVIPFFGPFIGAIPSVMILLIVNHVSAVWFTVFIVVLQQFDGNILGPKILGDKTGLPALWVLAAIIAGGGLFGFAGMIAGVPAVAVLHTLLREIVANRLRARGYDECAAPGTDSGAAVEKSPDGGVSGVGSGSGGGRDSGGDGGIDSDGGVGGGADGV